MLEKALEVTNGYASKEFEFWVSHQGIMYLYVHNVVYNIDLVGGCVARRAEDGEVISSAR